MVGGVDLLPSRATHASGGIVFVSGGREGKTKVGKVKE